MPTFTVDLPIAGLGTVSSEITGPSPIASEPLTVSMSDARMAMSYSAEVSLSLAGTYRNVVRIGSVVASIGYAVWNGTDAEVQISTAYPDPANIVLASDYPSDVATSVVQQLLQRFTVATPSGYQVQQAKLEVSNAEKLALGHLYAANFRAYTKSDLSLLVALPAAAQDAEDRIIFTAKRDIAGGQTSIVLQADSVTGLLKSGIGGVTAADGKVLAIETVGGAKRSVSIDILGRSMSKIETGRLYWDIRRARGAGNSLPAESDVLATGILDLTLPINQAVT